MGGFRNYKEIPNIRDQGTFSAMVCLGHMSSEHSLRFTIGQGNFVAAQNQIKQL